MSLILHQVTSALDQGDGASLIESLAVALKEGVPPAALAQTGLEWMLIESGWDLRGAQWSHAFLALEAAHELALLRSESIGAAAVAGALVLLDGSTSTRSRPYQPALEPGIPEDLEEAVLDSDLGRAERSLSAAFFAGDFESRWFDLALSNFEGWGHRPLMAFHSWRLQESLRAPPGWLFRAAVAHGIPWDLHRERQGSSAAGAKVTTSSDFAESILRLEGRATTERALADGVPAALLVEGLLLSACRIFSALPQLRQLHGVTVSRACGAAILHHGAGAAALVRLTGFVEEGWREALASGRVRVPQRTPVLGTPWRAKVEDAEAQLVERDATPNFGHQIKLVEACGGLDELMDPALARLWSREVLSAALEKATPWRRVWASLCRHLDEDSESPS